ncbi:MAG: hypothetical protein ABF723_05210 [Lentilactobacillus hilgardii]|uniref:hypothetical protein n=1 Tax=Lentilactobacillus hilgardii TaxID=1588 RepID=UPI0039EAE132
MQNLSEQLGDYAVSFLKAEVKRIVEEKTNQMAPVTVNVDGLAKMTGVSTSMLYKHVIDTPEFTAIEWDLGTRRLFLADQVPHAWNTYIQRRGRSGLKRLPESLRRSAVLLKEG